MNTSEGDKISPVKGTTDNISDKEPEVINTQSSPSNIGNNNSNRNIPNHPLDKEENSQDKKKENEAKNEMDITEYTEGDSYKKGKKLSHTLNQPKEKKDKVRKDILKRKNLSKSLKKGSKNKNEKYNADNSQNNSMLQKKRKSIQALPEKCYKTIPNLTEEFKYLDKIPGNIRNKSSKTIDKNNYYAEYGNKTNLLGSFDLLNFTAPTGKKNDPLHFKGKSIINYVKNSNTDVKVNVMEEEKKKKKIKHRDNLISENENSKHNAKRIKYSTYSWTPTYLYKNVKFNYNEKEKLMNHIKNIIGGKDRMKIDQYAIGNNEKDTYLYLNVSMPLDSTDIDSKEFQYNNIIPKLTNITSMMEFILKCGTNCKYYSNIQSIIGNNTDNEKENISEIKEDEKKKCIQVNTQEKEKDIHEKQQEKEKDIHEKQQEKVNDIQVNQQKKEKDIQVNQQEKENYIQLSDQDMENDIHTNQQEKEKDNHVSKQEKEKDIHTNQQEKEKDKHVSKQEKEKDKHVSQREKEKDIQEKDIKGIEYEEAYIDRKNIWICEKNKNNAEIFVKEVIDDCYSMDEKLNWDKYKNQKTVLFTYRFKDDELVNNELYKYLVESSKKEQSPVYLKKSKDDHTQNAIFPEYTTFIVISNKDPKSLKLYDAKVKNVLPDVFRTVTYEGDSKKNYFITQLNQILKEKNKTSQ